MAGDGAPSGASGGQPPGGSQGAGNPGQADEARLTELVHRTVNEALTGALGNRLGRLTESLKRELEGVIAEKLSAAPAPASANQPATKKADADDRVATLEKSLAEAQTALSRERKTAAIRSALLAAGVKNVGLAMAALGTRNDLVAKTDPVTGEVQWHGKVRGQFGEEEKPLTDVVAGFLTENPELLPPVGGAGSGARGGRVNGNGAATVMDKPLETLTPEDIAKAKPEEKAALWEAINGSPTQRRGFFG